MPKCNGALISGALHGTWAHNGKVSARVGLRSGSLQGLRQEDVGAASAVGVAGALQSAFADTAGRLEKENGTAGPATGPVPAGKRWRPPGRVRRLGHRRSVERVPSRPHLALLVPVSRDACTQHWPDHQLPLFIEQLRRFQL
jgi:hypothetical protein